MRVTDFVFDFRAKMERVAFFLIFGKNIRGLFKAPKPVFDVFEGINEFAHRLMLVPDLV